jgi:ferredoxin
LCYIQRFPFGGVTSIAIIAVGIGLFVFCRKYVKWRINLAYPATTPLTYLGQVIFGVGLGVLTVLIQTYMGFWGGSILALIVMNFTSPMLDKVGKLKPVVEKVTPKLPKAKQFATVKTTECIRCGACMRVCCHKLSPILIKEAFDKSNVEKLAKLQADLCDGCGHCSFVCPARIDLKGSILRAKVLLHKK